MFIVQIWEAKIMNVLLKTVLISKKLGEICIILWYIISCSTLCFNQDWLG